MVLHVLCIATCAGCIWHTKKHHPGSCKHAELAGKASEDPWTPSRVSTVQLPGGGVVRVMREGYGPRNVEVPPGAYVELTDRSIPKEPHE
jgi:hypothetical protein